MNDDWQERQRQEQEREEQRRREEQRWQDQQREERRRQDEQRWQEEQRLDQQRREREENDRLLFQQRQREQEQQYRRELAREAEERRVKHTNEYNEALRRREAEEARRRSTPMQFGDTQPRRFDEPPLGPSPPPMPPRHYGAAFQRNYDVEPYQPDDRPRGRGPSAGGSAATRWLAVSVLVLGVVALAVVGIRFAEDFMRQRRQAAASARIEAASRARVESARRNLPALKPVARRFLLAGLADPATRSRMADHLPRCYASVVMQPVPKAMETLRAAARSSGVLAQQAQDAAMQFALVEACVLSEAPTRGLDFEAWTRVFKPLYYESGDRSSRSVLNLLDASGETRAGGAADARRLAVLIQGLLLEVGTPGRSSAVVTPGVTPSSAATRSISDSPSQRWQEMLSQT